MNINNKTILITGAASGLGAATARLLSAKGAKMILLDRQFANGVQVCDVTDPHAVQSVISTAKHIHVAINCAGIILSKRLVGKSGAMPLEDFTRVMHVNVTGTLNVMRLVAEKMSLQETVDDSNERGVIINTSSIAAFEGQIGQVAYSASKGAVAAMTLPAARELSRFGIRVMSIAPGIMDTAMVAGFSEEVRSALCADVPFPKRLGYPDDFAALVVHIIENPYLNGETIRLDGALRMQ